MSDPTLFSTRQWLCLHGTDAAAFAQSQFCSDVSLLSPGQWQYSAWLDAPGRVRALFYLLRTGEDRFHLLLRGGEAGALVEPLRRYVFRAKVRIDTAMPEPAVPGATLPDAAAATGVHVFAREDALLRLNQPGGAALYVALDDSASDIDAATALAEVRAGLPRLPDAAAGELLPAWMDFERLGAISYKKGCYPGQEIAARLYFRGGNNRHLHRLRIQAPADCSGLPLRDGAGKEAGRLLQTVATGDGAREGLAVLRDGIDHQSLQLPGEHAARIEVLSAQWAAPA